MKMLRAPLIASTLIAGLSACAHQTPTSAAGGSDMDAIAKSYVRQVLALGEHDSDYVDAYYGPPEWREEVKQEKRSLQAIRSDAAGLAAQLATVGTDDSLERLRRIYLQKQLAALVTRLDQLSGKKLTFDQESQALYDATAPHHDEAYFQSILKELDRELPGTAPLPERVEAFRMGYAIPRAKLDAVFKAAIAGCRARTIEHLSLPEEESFTVEYVTNKSWSGYNWYQGNFKSLIQVNTDLPIFIDRAIDLACHEGYPGHHVYNVLLEKNLVRDRGWVEFSVYPLFSPQSLIAEGSANYGIDVAFPGQERLRFERDVLYPLAGLDPATADRYARIQQLTGRLNYAGNEAARRYLDGEFSADQAAEWLNKYALMSPQRARQRISFFDKYRSYVINYNLGRDLVAEYVERKVGASGATKERWEIFGELLSSPRIPSTLK